MLRACVRRFDLVLGSAGLVFLSLGGFLRDLGVFAGGVAALVCVGALHWRTTKSRVASQQRSCSATSTEVLAEVAKSNARPRPNPLANVHDTGELVEAMIRDGRFALLLRAQIIGNLEPDQIRRAVAQLEQAMTLIPAGPVCVGLAGNDPRADDEAEFTGCGGPEIAGRIVMIDPLFLDRYCVTNAEFQHFVDCGGYEQMALWDEEALPAMLDFVDLTGQPGPRHWRNGVHAESEARAPVVGVSWYEAVAYARWCGKRLPTDAEWVKAGAWPVESSPGHLVHRRYPWGNAFDGRRANVWGSGHNGPVAVDDYAPGVSIGGSHQLIGNVWEWTSSNFGDPDDHTLRLSVPMRSIRGGAFDTYFENQATCHFQSGDSPLSRKHNIGFRLALGTCDVAPDVGIEPVQTEEPAAIAV